jgi:2'-5' RNA ligase
MTARSADDRLRLFVALELPEAWKAALGAEARALEAAAPGYGRWVDPSLMHLTLVFLGSQPAEVVPSIEAAMDRAAATAEPLKMALRSPGSFGGARSVRVIWVGVEESPAGALIRLHEALLRELRGERITFDAAPFRAHITLGRARRNATPTLSEAMHRTITTMGARDGAPRPEACECREVALVRSDLRPAGPVHTPLHGAPLGQPLDPGARF